jgi:hypothetical protein
MNFRQAVPSTIGTNEYFIARRPTSSGSSSRYKPSSLDFVKSFYAVLDRWQKETAFDSDPNEITKHQSFRAMVNNAALVLPLIIDELRTKPSLLVLVLDEALKIRPYPTAAAGNVPEMARSWIEWAERNGRV